ARYPAAASWIVAVHESEDDLEPLGTAVVLDERRFLTCAHVVAQRWNNELPLWMAFPVADEATDERRRVAPVQFSRPVYDLALLHLEGPIPPGVDAAPFRCPKGDDLVGQTWSAFGFARRSPLGNSSYGLVGSALGYGFIRLDAESPYPVEQGFSGAGLWSPEYAAVVGIVGAANERGAGLAVTFHQRYLCCPDEKLLRLVRWRSERSGEAALTSWGWTLSLDPEAGRHWRPRARGVTVDSERGYRFRGRQAALEDIAEWLSYDDYLLHADLDRLLPLVDEASSVPGQERARLLRLTPYANGASPENRIALFSVTEALENLTPKYRAIKMSAPYRARWAATAARAERAVLEGHTAAVSCVCSLT